MCQKPKFNPYAAVFFAMVPAVIGGLICAALMGAGIGLICGIGLFKFGLDITCKDDDEL